MVLLNSESVDFDSGEEIDGPIKRSYLHWLSFTTSISETTRITAQRYRYTQYDNHLKQMFGQI